MKIRRFHVTLCIETPDTKADPRFWDWQDLLGDCLDDIDVQVTAVRQEEIDEAYRDEA